MLTITTEDKLCEAKKYCQQWLTHVVNQEYDVACGMLDEMSYVYDDKIWNENEIIKTVLDYRSYLNDDEILPFTINGWDIDSCEPSLSLNDDEIIISFYLPVNDKLTELTVVFAFITDDGTNYTARIDEITVF